MSDALYRNADCPIAKKFNVTRLAVKSK